MEPALISLSKANSDGQDVPVTFVNRKRWDAIWDVGEVERINWSYWRLHL